MANYLVGSGSHRLELGAGLLFGVAGADTEDYRSVTGAGVGGVTTTFGYRYQPADGGFLFRAGLTPFYSAGRPQLWGGVSVGYSFLGTLRAAFHGAVQKRRAGGDTAMSFALRRVKARAVSRRRRRARRPRFRFSPIFPEAP